MSDAQAHGSGNRDEVAHTPLPLKIYGGVAAALFALTAITVWTAQHDFGGHWNLLIAMAIACSKASLVVLFFMNLRYDHDRVNGVVFLGAALFLAIYFTFTLADAWTRGDLDPKRAEAAPLTLRLPPVNAAPPPAAH